VPCTSRLVRISKGVHVNGRAFTPQVLDLNEHASELLRQSPSKVDLLVVDGYVSGACEHVHVGASLKRSRHAETRFFNCRCDEFRLGRLLLELFTKSSETSLLSAATPQSAWSVAAKVIWIRGMFVTSVLHEAAAMLLRDKIGPEKSWDRQSAAELLSQSIHYLDIHGYCIRMHVWSDSKSCSCVCRAAALTIRRTCSGTTLTEFRQPIWCLCYAQK
jgi:hypothetical protein